MKVDVNTACEIAKHEGLVRQAYRDSHGILTWSIGVTSASGHKVERYVHNPVPLERCLGVYVWLLQTRYAPAVEAAFRGRALTQEQFAAALSFHWNTGAIGYAMWPKLWLLGREEAAYTRFLSSWSMPPEIIPRRKAERALFFEGLWSNDGTTTEYTQVTQRLHPVWSSARRIDIRPILTTILETGNDN